MPRIPDLLKSIIYGRKAKQIEEQPNKAGAAPQRTTANYEEPVVLVKTYPYLRAEFVGELVTDPRLQNDSELIQALTQMWERISKPLGISTVVLQNSYSCWNYDLDTHIPMDIKDFWVSMVAVKDGVPYFIDFNVDGLAAPISMSIWHPAPAQPDRELLEVTALEAFYPPRDLLKLQLELSTEELGSKNRELAQRLRIPERTAACDVTMHDTRDRKLEERLITEIQAAPELKPVHVKYLLRGWVVA